MTLYNAWVKDGYCHNKPELTDLFFPPIEEGDTKGSIDLKEQVGAAFCKAVECPVIEECLEFAIQNGLRHGVFGGTTGKDREDPIRERKKAI